MDVLDLVAKITLDASEYDKGLDASKSKAASFGSALKTGIGTAAKVGVAAITAVGTAAVGASAAFVKGTSSLAEYGDNIDKMSQKMGISAQGYQEWEAVMQHSGTSMETLRAGMKTLANAVENGNDAFNRLGITQKQIASMSNEELFNATITALQGVENETERTYLAGQLLGRGATELGALLNTSAEETQAMKDRVHELGGVMSDEAVKAAAHYQDTLQDMQTAFSGLQRGLLSEFLPTVTTVMEGLTELFSGDDKGIGKINNGVTEFVDKMSDALPKVLDTGAQIINSLVMALTKNIPQLVSAGVQTVGTLADGLIQGIPVILQGVDELMMQMYFALLDFDWAGAASGVADKIAGLFDPDSLGLEQTLLSKAFGIIEALASGIGQAAPTLLPAAIDLISNFVNFLAEEAPLMIDAAFDLVLGLAEGLTNPTALNNMITSAMQLIMSLADGLIDALPRLYEKAPIIIDNLVNVLTENAPKLIVCGIELIIKLQLGMIQALPQLVAAIPQIIGSLVSGFIDEGANLIKSGNDLIKFVKEGFESLNPAEWGRDMIDSLVSGIKSGIGKVKDAVGNIASTIKSYIHFSEPDVGPLSNFHTYAPDMMKLFAKGISDNEDIVARQMEKSFTLPDITNNVSATDKNGAITINVYGAEGQSVERLADIVQSKLLHELDMQRAVSYA